MTTPAAPLSQKEYLKKYLGYGRAPGDKKKKKKLKKGVSNRITIIDDDAHANAITIQDEDPLQVNEDAPQIVAIIDERPPSMRIDERTNSHLWKPIGLAEDSAGDNADGKQMITAFKIEKVDPITEALKALDRSPPRKKKSKKREREKSPTVLNMKVEVESPPRQTLSHEKAQDSSPPRRSDGDQSPPRKRHGNDTNKNADQSPPRKRHRDDNSPPRRRKEEHSSNSSKNNRDNSPPRRYKPSDDLSPKRNRRNKSQSPSRKSRRDRDESPARRNRRSERSPHRKRYEDTKEEVESSRKKSRWADDSPRIKEEKDAEERPAKTLDGKTAGLQRAKELAEELAQCKTKEDQFFKHLSKDVSGENAAAVQRDRRTGKIRNVHEEEEAKRRKEEEEQKQKEKYTRWGRGLAQVENREQKIQEEMYEMTKPLARYADDEDLEKYLKEQEREGDPMLQYLRSKKKKKAVEAGIPLKPQFEGEFMPNRYGIRPGHRWDGVDRSNGYEKKWFEVQNEKRSQIEEIYKWNTEDM